MTKRTANLTHVSRRRTSDAPVNQLNILDSLEHGLDLIEMHLDRDSAKGTSDSMHDPESDPLNWSRYAASRMHDFGQR